MATTEFESVIRMKWEVKAEDISRIIRNNIELDSDKYDALKLPGVKYYLSLQLDKDNPNELNIYLYLDFEMTKRIRADFIIFVKSASHKKAFHNEVFEESTSWGSLLCNRYKLFEYGNKFFVRGVMEIELDVVEKVHNQNNLHNMQNVIYFLLECL